MTERLFKLYEKYTNENNHEFPNKKNNIRIMTFNIHMWKNCRNNLTYHEILKVIQDSNADIVGLQEIMLYNKTIKNTYLEKMKEIGYTYHVICNNTGVNAVFSKYAILYSDVIKLVRDPVANIPRYATHCKIQINNKDLDIVVTHLDVFDESEETRLTQIKHILNNTPTNSIIMGDFNCARKEDYTSEEWEDILKRDKKRNVDTKTNVSDYLKSNSFVDISEIVKNKMDMSVWSMRRVDYIYVPIDFKYKISKYETYPSLVSDHYPVYVDIRLK